MSLASKIVLGSSCAVALGIIVYIHVKQQYDRDQLHLGVIKDLERQKRRRIQNIYLLQQQSQIEKEYRREALNEINDDVEPAVS